MKMLICGAVVLLATGGLTSAYAQPVQAPAAARAQAAAPSDETVAKFATVMLRFKDLQKEGKGGDQQAMAGVISDVGISFDDYNKITTAMRTDTTLNDRVQAAYRNAVMASEKPAAGSAVLN